MPFFVPVITVPLKITSSHIKEATKPTEKKHRLFSSLKYERRFIYSNECFAGSRRPTTSLPCATEPCQNWFLHIASVIQTKWKMVAMNYGTLVI